jgi:hypothetical protein
VSPLYRTGRCLIEGDLSRTASNPELDHFGDLADDFDL